MMTMQTAANVKNAPAVAKCSGRCIRYVTTITPCTARHAAAKLPVREGTRKRGEGDMVGTTLRQKWERITQVEDNMPKVPRPWTRGELETIISLTLLQAPVEGSPKSHEKPTEEVEEVVKE
ncbi:hypothetical protein TrRE_jg10942 [Triparma retinervis]|uniref:Uncharacterized protein n=1 Tax=Triparma retinervis TaxID=2557542 RepID=A0A9W7A769_9STRA|nr:hypothetical protein TrRE_jg10942 [Triparma retinervis]